MIIWLCYRWLVWGSQPQMPLFQIVLACFSLANDYNSTNYWCQQSRCQQVVHMSVLNKIKYLQTRMSYQHLLQASPIYLGKHTMLRAYGILFHHLIYLIYSNEIWLARKSISRYGCFQKWGYPQIIYFSGIFAYVPSIFGYPHLWRPPYLFICNMSMM